MKQTASSGNLWELLKGNLGNAVRTTVEIWVEGSHHQHKDIQYPTTTTTTTAIINISRWYITVYSQINSEGKYSRLLWSKPNWNKVTCSFLVALARSPLALRALIGWSPHARTSVIVITANYTASKTPWCLLTIVWYSCTFLTRCLSKFLQRALSAGSPTWKHQLHPPNTRRDCAEHWHCWDFLF